MLPCVLCGSRIGTLQNALCSHVFCEACRHFGPVCPAGACTSLLVVETDGCRNISPMYAADIHGNTETAVCTDCGISIGLAGISMLTCPHTIFSQISAPRDLAKSDVPVAEKHAVTILKMPAHINGRATHSSVDGDCIRSLDCKSLRLSRSTHGTIVVDSCLRNLRVRFDGGTEMFLLRGMRGYEINTPWPSSIDIVAPPRLEHNKPWPCQLLQTLMARPQSKMMHRADYWTPGTVLLFSADFQFVTHPAFNKHIGAEPMIGSVQLYPTKHLLLGGIFCSCCRRAWETAGLDGVSSCTISCGEPGMIDAHLQVVLSKSHAPIRAEDPKKCIVALDAVKPPAIDTTVADDIVLRFGWVPAPTPGRLLPAGCVAILLKLKLDGEPMHQVACEGQAEALCLFLTAWHARDYRRACHADVLDWMLSVHNRSAWTELPGQAWSALVSRRHMLVFAGSAANILRLLTV